MRQEGERPPEGPNWMENRPADLPTVAVILPSTGCQGPRQKRVCEPCPHPDTSLWPFLSLEAFPP